jgi:hypothetical protein
VVTDLLCIQHTPGDHLQAVLQLLRRCQRATHAQPADYALMMRQQAMADVGSLSEQEEVLRTFRER